MKTLARFLNGALDDAFPKILFFLVRTWLIEYRTRFHSILGEVAVFRKDLKPLEPDYLEAFCEWIEVDLLPKFTNANKLIKHALDNEVDDENRGRTITTIK